MHYACIILFKIDINHEITIHIFCGDSVFNAMSNLIKAIFNERCIYSAGRLPLHIY